MIILYTFTLPTAVDGMTHVGITEEIRDNGRFKLTGAYGTESGSFVPATMMQPYKMNITGDNLIDLDEQSLSAGRPISKSRHDIDSVDLITWLSEDPATIQARIDAKKEG